MTTTNNTNATADNPYAYNPYTKDGSRRLGLNPKPLETENSAPMLNDVEFAEVTAMDEAQQNAAAEDLGATPALLNVLASSPFETVQWTACWNRNTPPLTLQFMAVQRGTANFVKEAIATNEAAHDITVEWLDDGTANLYAELANHEIGRRVTAAAFAANRAADIAAGWNV